MIDWTDRFCRYFHRQLTRHARLYTEMIVDEAILRGEPDHLLAFDESEHPVALQLGGSEPDRMAAAAKIGVAFGYDEINMNVGCPSDRVQSGRFGACLMQEPERVADCVTAMREAVDVPVTVKCRIGVDDQTPAEVLPRFIEVIAATGCCTLIIHARMAWLQGLSPKENRTVPPLDYPLVAEMKERFPDLTIVMNGGIQTLDEARNHLTKVDGVMLGRAAYEQPFLLSEVDHLLFRDNREILTRAEIVRRVAEKFEAEGQPVWRYARHMLGLFHGLPGARGWRRQLSEKAQRPTATAAWFADLARETEAQAMEILAS